MFAFLVTRDLRTSPQAKALNSATAQHSRNACMRKGKESNRMSNDACMSEVQRLESITPGEEQHAAGIIQTHSYLEH